MLFKGIVQAYCQAQNVALDREVELGRGPVDFVISTDATNRVLLEVKKVSSDKFVDGLETQLVSYMKSDNCRRGWYLGVQFYDSASETRKIGALSVVAKRAKEDRIYAPDCSGRCDTEEVGQQVVGCRASLLP